jgi:hypothetical protein
VNWPYYIAAHTDEENPHYGGEGSLDIGRIDDIGSDICLARLHESFGAVPMQLYLGPSMQAINGTVHSKLTIYDRLLSQFKFKKSKPEKRSRQCPKEEQKPVCQLGNIFDAISDRDFALLAYDSKDCSIHLIFSKQTNADKLNRFDFASKSYLGVPHGWLSLYTSEDDGKLKPVLSTATADTHLICAPSNCNRIIHDPITGTNRFDCDISKNCTFTYDDLNWHLYVNDPWTNIINILAEAKVNSYDAETIHIGSIAIGMNGSGAQTLVQYSKKNKHYFWTFAYDSAENV